MTDKPQATPEQREHEQEMQLQAEYHRGESEGLGQAKRLLLQAAAEAFMIRLDGDAKTLRRFAGRIEALEEEAEKLYRECSDAS